jgi:CarD family transcriptional regulator
MMRLPVGEKVIYPSQGPCRIRRIDKKVINGAPIRFYHLDILGDAGGELYIPLDKAQAIGVRLLMDRSEIPKLLSKLQKPTPAAEGWRQRAIDNLKLFTSGSAFDLAEVVQSLTELSDTKTLTVGEARTLDKAIKLLVGEIAEVTGQTKVAAQEQVDEALRARVRR